MSLYAVDDQDLIHASEAENGKTYWCMNCFGPVKRRRGKNWIFHFYHLKTVSSCRLYSKTEDHFLAQIQLQKIFEKGELSLEKPFIKINRVADACLDHKRIVFEIQCSQLTEKEAEMRLFDYRSIGYEVVWLLDDRRYNKRLLKPEEPFLRAHTSYFHCIKKNLIYDQFEILNENRRLKKSRPLLVDLKKVYTAKKGRIYFKGDRLYYPHLRWQTKRQSPFKAWIKKKLLNPYTNFLRRIVKIRVD